MYTVSMAHKTKLHFYGGAGAVTGSNFLLRSENFSALVDCGMSQGDSFSEARNWDAFPYDPKDTPTLVVTHAHIDHIGRIPRLVRNGFRGRILSTEVTRALAEPLWADSLDVLAHDPDTKNKEPLFDDKDMATALRLWEPVEFHAPVPLGEGMTLELLNAGHILGSAMARFSRDARSVIFTGDLGSTSVLLSPHDSIEGSTYLVMESVYGDKTHAQDDPNERRDLLREHIIETAKRGGTLLIPAFATERTQDLLFEMRTLFADGAMPDIPVYLDSPLAAEITNVFLSFPRYFGGEMEARIKLGENIFSFPNLRMVADARESADIIKKSGPKVVIAGSGMSNGGRVLAHEKTVLKDPNSTLLLVGYQAAGSLGRRLLEGVRKVTLMGEAVPVKCHIETSFGYSAHMDGPHLLSFAGEARDTLEKVFVVMGEPASAGFLAQRLSDEFGIRAETPESGGDTILEL